MRPLLRSALLLSAAAAALLSSPAAAQSDILLRLRSGSPLGDRFRVDSASGFVARGYLGIGIIPFTGAGERVMWHPFKGSFRAGGVDDTQWDDANMGFYTLATGYNTVASGNYSVAIGYNTKAQQAYGVSLGYTTNSDGAGAVALGYRSTADANYSVALGFRASANGFTGVFVASDASTNDSTEASANNQFMTRYAGGYRLFTNSAENAGVSLNAGGSSWNVISDVNRKEAFLPVDPDDILARIRSLPVSTWRYTGEEDGTVRHIGPMAQDWQRAFGFSRDSTTINMSDMDGVNLAAVKALEERTTRQADEISQLRARNAELEARLARLEALVAAQQAP